MRIGRENERVFIADTPLFRRLQDCQTKLSMMYSSTMRIDRFSTEFLTISGHRGIISN